MRHVCTDGYVINGGDELVVQSVQQHEAALLIAAGRRSVAAGTEEPLVAPTTAPDADNADEGISRHLGDVLGNGETPLIMATMNFGKAEHRQEASDESPLAMPTTA